MQGTTNPPKRQRAAQTRLVQSIVRLTKVKQEANRRETRRRGVRRAQNTNESNKNMHWRGTSAPVTSTDRHTSTESHAQTPYTWEDGTPVHLSRLRKDTPVKMKNPNDQNGEGHTGQGGAKSRSLPGQKGPPPTAARGGQKRKLHQAGRTMRQCKKCDLGVNGEEEERGLCLTSCSVFEVVLLVCTESIVPAIPNGKGDRVLSFIHCSHAT